MKVDRVCGRTTLMTVENKNGRILDEQNEVLNRWKEYIEELYETKKRSGSLHIEDEEEVSEDYKGFTVLRDEFEKALRDVRNGKATIIDVLIELRTWERKGTKKYFKFVTKYLKRENGQKTF